MVFANQEDVFSVIEKVLPPVFEKYGKFKKASKAPFVRIAYNDALEKYGSDKPDLRIDLQLSDVTQLLQDTAFEPFKNKTVKAVVVDNFFESRKFIENLIADIEVRAQNKIYWFKIDEQWKWFRCWIIHIFR